MTPAFNRACRSVHTSGNLPPPFPESPQFTTEGCGTLGEPFNRGNQAEYPQTHGCHGTPDLRRMHPKFELLCNASAALVLPGASLLETPDFNLIQIVPHSALRALRRAASPGQDGGGGGSAAL